MPEVSNIAPILPADDMPATLAWYEERLGFRLLFAYPPERPYYASVQRGAAEIHFYRMAGVTSASGWMCYVRVNGVSELYAEYEAKGLVDSNAPPQPKPWGQTEFAVIDPNGHLLTFGEQSS